MKPRERAEVGEVAEIDARAKGKDRVGWHSPELQGAGQTEVNRFLGPRKLICLSCGKL